MHGVNCVHTHTFHVENKTHGRRLIIPIESNLNDAACDEQHVYIWHCIFILFIQNHQQQQCANARAKQTK